MTELAAFHPDALLDARGLRVHFPIKRGLWRRTVGYVKAVDDVSLYILEGETLALVGESGCGKTTIGRAILQAQRPNEGEVWLRSRDGEWQDLTKLDRNAMRPLRQEMQLIFQDPFGSLNPRMTVKNVIGEPLVVNGVSNRSEVEDRVSHLLRVVGLRSEFMSRYPHAFSGGQRQRISIARALALNPRLVIADEPVSALDVSVQAQTLNLLRELQREMGLTYLFISHDLSVVEYISDRVAVMYVGQIVEMSETEELFQKPRHPYTEALLLSVPNPDPRVRFGGRALEGEVADPADPPSGCYFHPRCPYAQEICISDAPEWREASPGHWSRCHFAEELELTGVPA